MNSSIQRPTSRRGARAYARVSVETDALSADSCHLITMLFDGVDRAIASALASLRQGELARKGEYISKALDIVNMGLLAAVDRERGGQLAEHLCELYEYIAGLLVKANMYNDEKSLELARQLLSEIGSAWRQIDLKTQRQV